MGDVRRVTRKYDETFIQDALDLLKSSGRTIRGVAKDLGIPEGTLSSWQRRREQEPLVPVERSETPEQEIQRLRKELREAKMEVEILKKATAFFAKENL